MRRHWKVIVIAALVAVAVLSAAAVALGSSTPKTAPAGRGTCADIMRSPAALKAMRALRAEHWKDMQAWRDKYGADPTSAEAQAALQALRRQHWNDMKALLQKYGVKVPSGAGPGGAASGAGCVGAGGGGCGGVAGSATGAGAGSSPGYGPGMMGGGGVTY